MMSDAMTAFLISIAVLLAGLAFVLYNKQLARRTIESYRKSFFFRSFGPHYDSRPLRVENIIVGITFTAMGFAGILSSLLSEPGQEFASLKTISIAGAGFILFSVIIVQVIWFGYLGSKKQ